MLNLRERAHHCLDEFRKGRSPPTSRHGTLSEPPTPVDDNDELAMLGGKTRLVKKEPTSPLLLDRSPNSQNPVVPLPLPASVGAQVDPNVLEYLSSFQSHSHSSQHSASTYSDVDISPVSIYGMSTISPFHSEPGTYGPQSPQNVAPPLPGHRQQVMSNGTSSFPQYFPVYDYGMGSMENGYSNGVPILDGNPMRGQKRSSTGSPEANTMHTTWQDFVGGLVTN